ncbi:MAG: uroporphyrinogen decarboxylase family protein [Candidatus Helarchaeota archaeon]
MDFKERLLITLNHEEPDRVPVMSLSNEPAVLNQYYGKQSINYFKYLKRPLLKQIIKTFMNWNWYWNKEFFNIYKRIIQMSIEMKFDAIWLIYLLFKLKKADKKQFPLGYAWYDIYGRVWELCLDDYGNPTPYYIRGNCTTEKLWDTWIEQQAPLFDKMVGYVTKFFKQIIEDCGKDIYIVCFGAPGIFENSWQPIGFVEFTKYLYEKPKFIEKVVEFQTDYYLKLLEGICKAGTEFILTGDDLGHKKGLLINPKYIDQYFAPAYKRVADFVHQQNKKLIFHSCGRIYKLLDKFIDFGFDGVLTLEPTAGMDLATVRKQVGHKLVLVGNLDVSHLLVRGTKKEVEDAVKHAIKVAAPGGGFILAPAHNHEKVDPTRLQWMVEAAHEYGRYPIQL